MNSMTEKLTFTVEGFRFSLATLLLAAALASGLFTGKANAQESSNENTATAVGAGQVLEKNGNSDGEAAKSEDDDRALEVVPAGTAEIPCAADELCAAYPAARDRLLEMALLGETSKAHLTDLDRLITAEWRAHGAIQTLLNSRAFPVEAADGSVAYEQGPITKVYFHPPFEAPTEDVWSPEQREAFTLALGNWGDARTGAEPLPLHMAIALRNAAFDWDLAHDEKAEKIEGIRESIKTYGACRYEQRFIGADSIAACTQVFVIDLDHVLGGN